MSIQIAAGLTFDIPTKDLELVAAYGTTDPAAAAAALELGNLNTGDHLAALIGGEPAPKPKPRYRKGRKRKLCAVETCGKQAQGSTGHCIKHGGGKRCQTVGCTKSARGSTDHCVAHGGGRRCQTVGCPNSAAWPTDHCIGCGGGRRCQTVGCPNSAQAPTDHCKSCGGGRRCQTVGCPNGAEAPTDHCKSCGGGRRCQTVGCPNSAAGSTDHCKSCGGGRRCQTVGCPNAAQAPTDHCIGCGGGRRCQTVGCPNSAKWPTDHCIGCGGGRRCQTVGCPNAAQAPTDHCIGHDPAKPDAHPKGSREHAEKKAEAARAQKLRYLERNRAGTYQFKNPAHRWDAPYEGYLIGVATGLVKPGLGGRQRIAKHRCRNAGMLVLFTVIGRRIDVVRWESDVLHLADYEPVDPATVEHLVDQGATEVRTDPDGTFMEAAAAVAAERGLVVCFGELDPAGTLPAFGEVPAEQSAA